jgi:hypothetical protein
MARRSKKIVIKPFIRGFAAAFLIFLGGTGVKADSVLFTDDFAPTGAGPGTNWIALAAGYPDLASARILDGTRPVLHMQSSSLTPAQQRGIQLANVISLAPVTGGSHLHVDLGFQPRTGGTNSSVTLQLTGANASLQVFTQDSIPRQVAASGSGSAGVFSTNSGSNVYTNLTYYHFTVDVFSNGTTVSLLSDNGQTVFWQYTTTALQLNDFGGSLGLQVYQVTGGGVAENYLDQITVSSSSSPVQSQSAPGAMVLSSIPSTWAVHFVTNSSKTIMTMYYGSDSGYQPLAAFMQTNAPKGMGNAFDPGPALASYNTASWQWLASNGYPSIAYTPIWLTNAINSTALNLLNIMNNAGLFTSVQFGEWGYHFHADQPYGTNHGYPVVETNKVDCYNFMKYAYQQQTATYRLGWANAFDGHSHYECYAAEWGCRMVGIEVGENIAFAQSKIAFTRGASRQWNIPWSMQMSPWWNGYETTYSTLDYGHSLSLYQRMLMHGWFAGAAWITPENSYDIVFNLNYANLVPTSWAGAMSQIYAFINAHDRGIPYTPLAVVLDHYAGYNAYLHNSWGTLNFTAGDTQIDDLFCSQLFPNSDFIHYNPFPADQELAYLRETPYGEIFDVLLSSATATNLESYPVILLAGDINFDNNFVTNLQQALQNGSRVLMQPAHQAALGSAFSTLTNAGTVEVLPIWTNSVNSRAAAVPNWRLAQLDATCLPVTVSGAPIQYSINRNAAGWVVELVHDNGVWKSPSSAAIVTNTDIAMVTLQPLVPVSKAAEWGIDANGNPADVDLHYTGAPLTVPVGPGQSVYVQFTLASSGGSTNFAARPSGPHSLTLNYSGLPNYSYHVQVTSNLASGIWTSLAGYPTNATSSGMFIFTDTNTANFNPRFYRIVTP